MKADKQKIREQRKKINCIILGTAAGIGCYAFFLYFDIAIFGWNLGLFFAPLLAGYVETYLAQKIVGTDTGAISAFILFLVTVIYGFIIDNPTLGINLITLASIIIIIQAAMPTVANYFGLVVIIGICSFILGFFKKIIDFIHSKIMVFIGKPEKDTIEAVPFFNEKESNELINSNDFYYFTSTDIKSKDYENLGFFSITKVFDRNTRLIKTSPQNSERKELNALKKGKDECLIRLANEIKRENGNGVINLEINYFLNGLGGSSFQIVASGIGVRIKE
ncbi:MAG: hypothetical protein K6A34_00960 [Methanobrevibacter sp.]|nr:hypothetical protein [Methanobrevibacter sp.]